MEGGGRGGGILLMVVKITLEIGLKIDNADIMIDSSKQTKFLF